MMGVGHGDGLALQPLLEFRIALGDGDMADSIPQGTLLTDDNADFLGTGDGGVDEVALEHDIVGEVDGDDDDGIFTALALVDGRGIGETEFVELRGLVFHCLAVEADGQCAVLHIDSGDESDVAVEHFLGVVVLELQHTVAFAEHESGTGESVADGVNTLLDGHVQTVGTDGTTLHRREYLYAAPWYIVGFRQTVADQVDDGRGYLLGFLAFHEEEVRLLAVADVGHPFLVDGVGVHNDTAGLCLTEDAGETDNGDDTGVDDVNIKKCFISYNCLDFSSTSTISLYVNPSLLSIAYSSFAKATLSGL